MYWVDWVLDISPKGAFINYLIREKHGMGVKQIIIKVTAHEREVDNFIDKQLRGFKPFLNQPYFLFLPSHHHEWVTLSKFLGFFPSNILTLHYNMPILYSKVE